MRERIWHIIVKEFRQTLREPRMRALLIGPPLIQLIVFGFAVTLDVDHARLGWMDLDRTPQSRELRASFEGSGRFTIVSGAASEASAQALLDYGRVDAVVRVLPGFGGKVTSGESTAVQILIDGANSNSASIVGAYATQVVARYGAEAFAQQQRAKLVGRTAAAGGPVALGLPAVEPETRVWFNPDLRSRNYFIPGVIVNIVALVTIMLTAMAIVREKEIGTMEQLMVTPIRPLELIIGKIVPFALAGLFETVFITTAALLIFGIPLRGSVLLLFAGSALFLLTTCGVGLFVSTVSQTQQQAVMASFFFFMPAFMLSGFSFPVRNMPEVVQWLSYLDPLRYFITIVRGIFLKGTGPGVLWPQMLALLVYGVLILGLSALRFHKRLD
ncbi:MAG TPA: ABC transporter permease [Bryobacteraceae bacterium]|nr:ABC transporter permease [Bryobacteraceae bacterium]